MNIRTGLDWLRARENVAVAVFWWSMPAAMLPMAIISSGYAQTVAWSAIFAAMACVAAIAAVSYRITSFVTIYCVMTLASYPLAAFANLLLSQPVVRADLWPQTHWAMWGCALGSLCLALGASAANLMHRRDEDSSCAAFSFPVAPVSFNLGLFAILPMVAWAKWHLGLYYHSSIQPYNFSAQHYLNSLEHLSWIAYVGIFLQMGRFVQTQSAKDGWIALTMIVIAVLIYFPSGNRMQAIGFIPLLAIAYLGWGTRLRQKALVISMLVIFGAVLFYATSIYRHNQDIRTGTIPDQISKFVVVAFNPSVTRNNSEAGFQFVHRLSDYVATGRIIAETPDSYPFRWFSGMGQWWQILVPGFLRPAGQQLNFMEGAETTLKYGVSVNRDSSTPVMLLGDLFSRFGWGGIIAGMFTLGFVLRKLDPALTGGLSFQRVFFFVLFARIVWQLYTSSLLVAFVSLTRELLVIFLISYVLGRAVSFISRRAARSV